MQLAYKGEQNFERMNFIKIQSMENESLKRKREKRHNNQKMEPHF